MKARVAVERVWEKQVVVVDAGVELECVQVHSLAELFRLGDSLASQLLPLALQCDGLC